MANACTLYIGEALVAAKRVLGRHAWRDDESDVRKASSAANEIVIQQTRKQLSASAQIEDTHVVYAAGA